MLEKISASGGKNKIFAYSVLALNVIAAWISWWVLAGAIFGKMRHIWLYPVLAFSVWGIAFTLSAIFVRDRKLLYGSFVAAGVGYLIFFGPSLSVLGALLAVLIFILTEIQAKGEIARGITINFYQLVSHTLKYFVTAVCVVIAIAYYFSIIDKAAAPTPTFIEGKTLQTEMDWGLKAAGFVLPDDKKSMIDDIADGETVDDFLSKNFVDPGISENMDAVNNAVPASATDTTKLIGNTAAGKIKEEMLAKSKKDLAKQLGVDVVGEQPMKNVLMAYIDKTERGFFDYSGTDKFYIPVILAFGIFLTARILGTAVDLLLGLFILGIIRLLRKTGVIQVSRVQREGAVIDYSI
ncbi:MAG: hypothetical protein NT170_00755 [Candidatus Moranbacteria bacterium]|nr:hypothetical protein [Candidatus Moranbacteria bacterium]